MLVVPAVLAAALLHAVWNAVAHSVPDRRAGFLLLNVALAFYLVGAIWAIEGYSGLGFLSPEPRLLINRITIHVQNRSSESRRGTTKTVVQNLPG